MRVAITIVSGPSAGQRFVLKNGQAASIGKSAWNDFAVCDDDRMEDTHFTLKCESSRSILATHPLVNTCLLNGRLLPSNSQHLLQDGDKIAAGRSEFVIRIEGAVGSDNVSIATSSSTLNSIANRERLIERISLLELFDEDFSLDSQITDGDAFEAKLKSDGLFGACLRWRGFHCNKFELIRWVKELITQSIGPQAKSTEQEASNACQTWLASPNDSERITCLNLAKKLKWRGPYGAMAAAVGWSEGSLTSDLQNPIPPDRRLTSRCTAIAIEELGRRLASPPDPKQWLAWIESMPKPNYDFSSSTVKD
ncbi:MAG: hypothetical protein MUD03_02730 [Pirellula sp.]|jgi:pSer/pThr/pTyr-binding forkhead associated (FHA) protein|nr:hypothetical protein [Pirellula sp.]